MDDLISRAAAIEAIVFSSENKFAVDVLNDVPAVDAVPVVYGKWELVAWHRGLKVVECSICGKRAYGATVFCPNCSVKMDSEWRDSE